jgi:hypothetical protein
MTGPIDAFHLPGLEPSDIERQDENEYGRVPVRLRMPVLNAGAMTRIAARVADVGGAAIRGMRPGDIVASIDAAARRLLDPADSLRIMAEEALPAITGYSAAMVRLVLDRAARDWTAPALEALLRSEFPGGELERFVPEIGTATRTMAVPPRLALHIGSGNVPGVAVTSIVRALLVRAPSIVKTAAGEPLLTVLFARALTEAEPRLADALAVLHWPGGRSSVEDEAIAAADTIVVYGGAETVRSIRKRAPARVRIIEHGPRASVGLIGRDALADDTAARAAAARAAWAVALFDQQGCVSPHVLWLESGAVDAKTFASFLGEAFDAVERELPRGTLAPGEAAAVHQVRTRAEFRVMAGEDVSLFEGRSAGWTVIRDADPAFEPSCLNRTIRVKPVERLEDAAELIAPLRGFVQSVAIEGVGDRLEPLARALVAAGATRITDFRRMPWPPPAWHHDGAGPLRELVTWTDLETG